RLHAGNRAARCGSGIRLRIFDAWRLRACVRPAVGVPAFSRTRCGDGDRAGPSSVLRMAPMKRITVVTGGHLSTSPRMLKAADAFSAAGYRVRVVCVRHTAWASDADRTVMANRSWVLDL